MSHAGGSGWAAEPGTKPGRQNSIRGSARGRVAAAVSVCRPGLSPGWRVEWPAARRHSLTGRRAAGGHTWPGSLLPGRSLTDLGPGAGSFRTAATHGFGQGSSCWPAARAGSQGPRLGGLGRVPGHNEDIAFDGENEVGAGGYPPGRRLSFAGVKVGRASSGVVCSIVLGSSDDVYGFHGRSRRSGRGRRPCGSSGRPRPSVMSVVSEPPGFPETRGCQ